MGFKSARRIITNLSIRNKLLFGLTLPILFIIFIGVSVYFGTQAIVDTQHWIEHTYQEIAKVHKLEKLIIDRETGQRGFLITGKDLFLEPFERSVKIWDQEIIELIELVSDNPEQVRRVKKIDQLSKDWMEKAALPEIAERRKVKPNNISLEYIQGVTRAKTGKNFLGDIRQQAKELEEILIHSSAQIELGVLANILKDVVDQESGQRGFLLTGDEEFLIPYHNGKKSFNLHINQLRTLALNAFEPDDILADMDRIEKMYQAWRDLEEESISRFKTQHTTPGTQHSNISIGMSKKHLDDIRTELNILQTTFQSLGIEKARIKVSALFTDLVEEEVSNRRYYLEGHPAYLDRRTEKHRSIEEHFSNMRSIAKAGYDKKMC